MKPRPPLSPAEQAEIRDALLYGVRPAALRGILCPDRKTRTPRRVAKENRR